jgi:hypothetical protein
LFSLRVRHERSQSRVLAAGQPAWPMGPDGRTGQALRTSTRPIILAICLMAAISYSALRVYEIKGPACRALERRDDTPPPLSTRATARELVESFVGRADSLLDFISSTSDPDLPDWHFNEVASEYFRTPCATPFPWSFNVSTLPSSYIISRLNTLPSHPTA